VAGQFNHWLIVLKGSVHVFVGNLSASYRATCHIGSHSVTCRSTQVNAPRYIHSGTGRYLIYLPRRDGRMSWPGWLVYLSKDSHPSTNRVRCMVTTLIVVCDRRHWLQKNTTTKMFHSFNH